SVDVSLLRTVPGPSGIALITVDERGENTIVVAPGANATVTALTAAERAAVAAADVLVCQLEVPVELLAAIDLLVVNEREAAIVVGGDDPLVPRLVVTLGAAGARYADRSG